MYSCVTKEKKSRTNSLQKRILQREPKLLANLKEGERIRIEILDDERNPLKHKPDNNRKQAKKMQTLGRDKDKNTKVAEKKIKA